MDLSGVAPAQPLAFNLKLIKAARLHSKDMNNRAFFGHQNPDGKGPGDRIAAAGYNSSSWAESIGAGTNIGPAGALSMLIIDKGVPSLGHRKHLLGINRIAATHHEVGIGIYYGNGPYKHYFTIDTATPTGADPAILTGVVYTDKDGNGMYSRGEGYRNVTITATASGSGSQYSTTTFRTGGYSLPLPAGTYTVTAAGGQFPGARAVTVQIGAQNVKQDFVPRVLQPVQLGVYAGLWRLDSNGNGRWDRPAGGDTLVRRFGRGRNNQPLVLDMNGDGRDELAFFRGGRTLFVDVNNDFTWKAGQDRRFRIGNGGDQAVAGDWNNDGKDEMGVLRDENSRFRLDSNGDGKLGPGDARFRFMRFRAGDIAVSGDWNGDGVWEVGLFRVNARGRAMFFLDANANQRWDGRTVDRRVVLRPGKFTGGQPAAANYDNDPQTELAVFKGNRFYVDMNNDGRIDRTMRFAAGRFPTPGYWS